MVTKKLLKTPHKTKYFTIFIIILLTIGTIVQLITPSLGRNSNLSNANFSSPIIRNTNTFEFDYNLEFDSQTQYLILSITKFKTALEPLAAWKIEKGVYTKIVYFDGPHGINSTYTGPDPASKIHSFLRDFYNNSRNFKWLLLIGDSEIIPTRNILINITTNASLTNINNFCYSDYYYSALDSTWDHNSNNVYGEPGEEDFVPDIYVGRLPVNTLEEANNVVNKILIYEKNPPNGDWFKDIILCGALMDRPNILDIEATNYIDEGYNWYKDNSYEVIQKIWNHLPKQINNKTFLDYDRIEGEYYSRNNDTLNESNVFSAFNSGSSVVNFVSHGNDNGVLHYNSKDGIGYTFDYYFNHEKAKEVANGFKLPLVYSSSCTSGNFTEKTDRNLERLITSPLGGAIGFIGATVDTYRLEFFKNDSSYGNWWLNAEFWVRFFSGEGEFRPGEILYKLKEDYYNHFMGIENPYGPQNQVAFENYKNLYRINFFAYNLLGDPEAPIYTDVPKYFDVKYDRIYSPVYRKTKLEIKVFEDGTKNPVGNANICLIGNGQYLVKKTDDQGVASFDLDIQGSEVFNITITGHNYNFFTDIIKIEAKEDLLIKQEEIKFERNPIPPGAKVNLNFLVFNNGTTDISGVKINCYYNEVSIDNLINITKVINELPKGTTKKLNITWLAKPGSHEIIIYVDPNNEIFEHDEKNNIARIILIENKPPSINKLPVIIIKEDTPSTILDLSNYIRDWDTEKLYYYIINTSTQEVNISINKSKIYITPNQDWHGNSTIKIGIFDGTSYDSVILKIFVQSVNDAPIINDTLNWIINTENTTANFNQITVYEDQVVDISVTGNDIDDNDSALEYGAKTNMFVINSTNGRFIFIPSNDDVGTFKVNFTLTDNHEINNNSWRIVEFRILNTNDAPKLKLDQIHYSTRVGEKIELKVHGQDKDPNDILRFSDNSKLFDIDPDNGYISFVPKDSQIGMHQVRITVSDGNATDSNNIIIEIKGKREEPLQSQYVIICPIVLVVIVVFIGYQEYLKNKRNTSKEEKSKLSIEDKLKSSETEHVELEELIDQVDQEDGKKR